VSAVLYVLNTGITDPARLDRLLLILALATLLLIAVAQHARRLVCQQRPVQEPEDDAEGRDQPPGVGAGQSHLSPLRDQVQEVVVVPARPFAFSVQTDLDALVLPQQVQSQAVEA